MMKNALSEGASRLSQSLIKHLESYEGLIVAFSGGVDSATLAYFAYQSLGEKMVAVIADSPSLSRRELADAKAFAIKYQIPLKIIETKEISNPQYIQNSGDRCYFCKEALFSKLKELQASILESVSSHWELAFGANLDDLGDYRPGAKAAQEFNVCAPFVDLKMSKEGIRSLGREFGLEVSDKPAMPCLASRIPHGERVSTQKLNQIEKAEDFLRDLGGVVLRVRHHGDLARIEVPESAMGWVMEHRNVIVAEFKKIGFLYISLDLMGFSSGSLNMAIGK